MARAKTNLEERKAQSLAALLAYLGMAKSLQIACRLEDRQTTEDERQELIRRKAAWTKAALGG